MPKGAQTASHTAPATQNGQTGRWTVGAGAPATTVAVAIAGPVPVAFFAATLNVYAVPFVRPVTDVWRTAPSCSVFTTAAPLNTVRM